MMANRLQIYFDLPFIAQRKSLVSAKLSFSMIIQQLVSNDMDLLIFPTECQSMCHTVFELILLF